MTRSLTDLREEMRIVARGQSVAPPVATVESISLQSVTSPANIALMKAIADHKPDSVSALALLLGRRQSNVSRSLQDLARFGLVRLVRDGVSIRAELAGRYLTIDLTNGDHTVAAE